MKANPFDLITLCYKCKRSFEETGDYNVRQLPRKERTRDKCDLCQVKYGDDYRITPSKRREDAQ